VYGRVLDGTESARVTIKWKPDVIRIVNGLGIANNDNKAKILRELLTGAARNAFNTGLAALLQAERERQAQVAADAAPDDAQAQIASAAVMAVDVNDNRFYTNVVLEGSVNAVIMHAVPKKALQQVKRYLRRDCRKPSGMKVRDYFTRITHINNEEIPHLPPHNGNLQRLGNDELADILLYGVPKSWVREMDRQGKDPDDMNVAEILLFLEQIELAEEFSPDGKKNQNNNNNKGKKGKPNNKSNQKGGNNNSNDGSGDYYCMLHGANNTHGTDDCRTMKQQAKKMKNKHSSGGSSNSKDDWKNKANNNKKKASKELNAVAKKAAQESAKAVVKELNAANKKRKSTDESDDDNSVNALEKELFAVDLGKISDHSDDEVSC